MPVLDTLVHELVHAVDDCQHKEDFYTQAQSSLQILWLPGAYVQKIRRLWASHMLKGQGGHDSYRQLVWRIILK